jgi:endonuclease/exonuclease/phosphatase family metal-dependent hydrolase
MERGTGWGRTYGRGLKSFRIDYIFTDPRLTVADFKTLETEGLSDHAALFTRLRFGFH